MEVNINNSIINYNSKISFYLNGIYKEDNNIQPDLTLLQYLRMVHQLKGTKLGCGEGGCGACTVMLSHYDGKKIINRSVNACLFPAAGIDGCHVITVEGIGNTSFLHPVQKRIAEFFGSQCGFCTPGFVMSLYSCLRNNPNPTLLEMEEIFDGNLCRCTGYRPILDAAKSFVKDKSGCSLGASCCQNSENDSKESNDCTDRFDEIKSDHSISVLPKADESEYKYRKPTITNSATKMEVYEPYSENDAKSELIFPPSLILKQHEPLCIKGKNCTWYRPLTIENLLFLKNEFSNSKIVCGNTEVGIDVKFRNMKAPVIIYIANIPDLSTIFINNGNVHFGAAASLTSVSEFIKSNIETRGNLSCQNLASIQFQLTRFASHQIRNVSCMGGNIINASPISDLNPVLQAANAIFVLASIKGERKVSSRDFFLSYRKVAIEPNEIIKEIIVPFTPKNEFAFAYKQARRRDDDISIVTAGFRVNLLPLDQTWKVDSISLIYGGCAPITKSASLTEKFLVGKIWNSDSINQAFSYLPKDFPMDSKTPGGQFEYRLTLTSSFLFKFFMYVNSLLPNNNGVSIEELKAAQPYHREISHGTQYFQESKEMTKVVGQSALHAAAYLQTTGEALYMDDVAEPSNILFAAVVQSNRAHAKVISIDPSKALAVPGVIDFVCGKDIPSNGHNIMGDYIRDEEVFSDVKVACLGLCMGLIVAETEQIATMAAKLIEVQYEDLPIVMSIDEAIKANSFFDISHGVVKGDAESAIKTSLHVLEGEARCGGQEHFYLETHCVTIVPGENNELVVISSNQNPSKVQESIAHVLGIPQHKIVVKTKRIGGGFGGKETRPCHYAAEVAVAAHKLKRPVKLIVERDIDMNTSGQRHPFLFKYRVGFNSDSKINGLDVQLFSNGGWSYDLSVPVMDRAILNVDACCDIPNARIVGRICRTNTGSNTAFRGFGHPQASFFNSVMLDRIAHFLKSNFQNVLYKNLYDPINGIAPYGQPVGNFPIKRMWEEILLTSNFKARQDIIDKFNSSNKYRKRGIAILPNKFPISFTPKFMNQAGALVHIYSDGSVLLSHGGVEMGQGLHTKMMQIAANAFGIPLSLVHVMETCTDKVANTFPTAASFSSDLNGGAILDACQQLLVRLNKIRESKPDLTWHQLIEVAYFDRVNLSAQGFFAHPTTLGINWDPQTGIASPATPFAYYSYGVAASEVEIDCLTGDWHCLRTDILIDMGASLNPGLDIGQIEGAFIQGLGWCTTEELIWGDSAHPWLRQGALLTKGPGNYKLPSANDIPIDFRCYFLKDARNPAAVHSSKAIGEPPLFLAASVFFAIKDAIRASRIQNKGVDEWFDFHSPATTERIRMACTDNFTAPFVDDQFQVKASV